MTTTGTAVRSSGPTTVEDWLAKARGVADELRADAVERDRANQLPAREVDLLKAAGLVTLLGRPQDGGGGGDWATAYRVVREIARADGSIAQLLGYSYLWTTLVGLVGTAEQGERILREATRGNWLFGGVANPRDDDLIARPEGDHLLFNGRKSFATGARVADVVILQALDPGGSGLPLQVVVPSDSPGLTGLDDWDNVGQRLSDSGSVRVVDVRGEWANALGYVDRKPVASALTSIAVPAFQLGFANIYLGIAQGALADAARYTRTSTRPAPQSAIESALDDPYILETYGELASQLFAVEALADTTGSEVSALLAEPGAITDRLRGEIAVKVAATKLRAARVGLEVTTKIFDVTGARATASSYGFDRYWRNIRTHSLHDPLAWKAREVGAYALLDQVPEPTWYT